MVGKERTVGVRICYVFKIRSPLEASIDLEEAHIFLLAAVMSRDALITRSRRSWCSSSSALNTSNIGMYGDLDFVSASSMAFE